MKSGIMHSSYVINFLNVGFNADEISKILKWETDEKLKFVNDDKLKDWEVLFNGIYGKGESIKVYKKMPSIILDKQKPVTIHIPVPSNDVVEWGVDNTQYVNIGKNPNEAKNVSFLDVSFLEFKNRTDYIMNCFQRVIDFCLESGFTINSVKVQK